MAGRDAGNGSGFLPRPAHEVYGDGATGALPSGEDGGCVAATSGDWKWPDRRLEREYIWHADPSAYVDECAAELVYNEAHNWSGLEETGDDVEPVVLYVLSDHNASVSALTDALGRVVAQYSYTPYGDLLAAEFFVPGSDSLATESRLAAAGHRLGHQGLRTERFDRPWDGPMDINTGTEQDPYRALCHNRNRMYDPAEGRFTGNDPNGLGLPVLGDLAYHGSAIDAMDVLCDIQLHRGNGMNTHAAYGSRPQSRRDPPGLFLEDYWEDLGQGAGVAYHGAATFLSFTDAGGLIGSMLQSLVSNYAMNQDADVDWALDWDTEDDWHSRGDNQWVQEAMLLGAYQHFGLDYWNDGGWEWSEGGSSGPAFAGAIQNTITIAGKIVRKGHLHHAMPRFLVRFFSSMKEVVGRLPTDLHQKFHKGLDAVLRRDGFPPMTTRRQKWTKFMQDNPQKVHQIRMRVRQFTAQFELENNVKGLLQAVDDSFP